MGRLIDGKWKKSSIITSDKKGNYARLPRNFRGSISKAGPFNPVSGRYHLYVSYACPWAQRTLIYRELKELQNHISLSVVHPEMMDKGWTFEDNFSNATGDKLYEKNHLFEIYQKAKSDVSTSVTVPVLWDKKLKTIVNNESSEIIRFFNQEFNMLTGNKNDYYPKRYRDDIDKINEKIYHTINNGVYKSGFAENQKAYDDAIEKLFKSLDEIDQILEGKNFLIGNKLTEADIRLIPTLLRFDLVYYIHFKCSFKKISEYKNLYRYTKDLYKIDAIKKTTFFDHIKQHYYYSHEALNPNRIIPKTYINLL